MQKSTYYAYKLSFPITATSARIQVEFSGPISVLFDLRCRWWLGNELFHVLLIETAFVEALLRFWVFVHLIDELPDHTFDHFVVFSSHVLWIGGSQIVDVQLKNLAEPVGHGVVRDDHFLAQICQFRTFAMACDHLGILLQLIFEISFLLVIFEVILNPSASEVDHGEWHRCSLFDVFYRHEVLHFTKVMPHTAILGNGDE